MEEKEGVREGGEVKGRRRADTCEERDVNRVRGMLLAPRMLWMLWDPSSSSSSSSLGLNASKMGSSSEPLLSPLRCCFSVMGKAQRWERIAS